MSEKLTDRVRKTQGDLKKKGTKKENLPLSKAALDAMVLADHFSSIQPDVYVLPLDAMAGFCIIDNKNEISLAAVI